MRRLLRWAALVTTCLTMLGGIAFADTSDNYTYGSGTYGTCGFGTCTLTLSGGGTTNVNVVPSATGKCTVQSSTVSVLTDSTTGYNLSMTTSTTNRSMTNGGNNVPASSGTSASPVSLVTNTWGYRVDGIGGFGSGPTSAQTSASTPSLPFAGVPASNQSAAQIASSSSAANPAANTTVWYGLCADTSVASGSYSVSILYTAVTN